MAESYSVKAKLSAVDSGFSSTLKGAVGALDSFKSKLSGIGFGMLSGVGSSLFNGITSGISDLVGEIDSSNASWKTFESNLGMLDWDSKAIGGAKKDLQEFAQQTVYSSSDMATTFAQLAAVGVDDTSNLVKAFGGLAAAAENPQQAMKTLSQQATQMAAKPQVAWQDFKLMLEQTPAGIAAVAREMGMTTSELVTAVQEGEVSTTKFFNAIKAAGGEGTELADLATEAKTIGQAMDGLKETVANKLTPAFDYLSQIGIKAVEGISDVLGGIDGESIKKAIVGWVEDAKPMWESFKNAASKVWAVISGVAKNLAPVFASIKNTMGGAVKSILDQIGKIDADALVSKISSGIAKAKPYWEAIRTVITAVAGAIAKVLPYIQKVGAAIGSFFLDNSSTIAKFIPYIAGAIGAFKGFKLVKGLFGGASSAVQGASSAISNGMSKIAQIINSVGDMFRSLGTGISYAARGIGDGIESVFTGIGKALKLANPVNILALGAAIAIVAAGFALLATQGDGVATILGGIGSVVESVGAALGGIISTAIKAIAEALVILAPVMPIIAQSLVMLTPLVIAFGQAFSLVAVAIGEAISKIVVAVGEGIARIIEALTPIVEILSNLVQGIVQIIVDAGVRIVEAIAPVLPAFTEAFTKIVEVVSNAIVSIIEILAPYIPEITKMVEATSQAIQAICEAFTTLVEQIVPVIESVTELISQLGTSITEILGGASELVTAFGDTISQVVESIGNAISGVIDSIGGVFDSMGEAALNAGKGFEHLANGIKTITKLNLLDMAASMTAVALSLGDLVKKSKGIAEAGKGMSDLCKGLKTASKTGTDDLLSLGEAAQTMVQTMSTAFTAGAVVAKTSGEQIGAGFTQGAAKGLAQAPTMATASVTAVNVALLAGAAKAYQAGAFISTGFANGMRSKLGEIRSAAAQMASAAQKALEAKAKISSPSKVTTKDGQWWGQGYANGMMDKVREVRKAAESLVTIPQAATPKLAMSYGGELDADYSYTNTAEYVIMVPVEVDGKEVARVTAPYYQAELNRRDTRDSRKRGKV
jgi:tape measure domain-containing protein